MATKNNFLSRAKSFLKKIHPNYAVFSVFLGVSTFFWLLNALGKEYTVEMPLNVNFENIPAEYALIQNSQHKVDLTFTGSGYTLIKFYAFPRYFSIDVDEYEIDSSENSTTITYNTEELFSQSLEGTYRIVKADPETIEITFSKSVEKILPVKTTVQISCDKNHDFKGEYAITPDSIKVSGPSLILDTIHELQVDTIKINDISSNVVESYDVNQIENVTLEKKTIEFSVSVEDIDDFETSIPVSLLNFPKKQFKQYKDLKVEIEYRTVESLGNTKLDTILQATIDFEKLNEIAQVIPIEVTGLPSRFEIISINPSFIEITK